MQDTQKKVNKLKRSRLWPSIVLFAISLLVGAFLLAAELAIFVTHAIETKYTQELVTTEKIAQGIDEGMRAGEGAQTALDQAAMYLEPGSQLFIMGDSGELLASRGDITVDIENGALLRNQEGQAVYLDSRDQTDIGVLAQEVHDNVVMTATSTPDIFAALRATQSTSLDDPNQILESSYHTKDTMVEYSFWQALPLEGEGATLFVKRHLSVQQDDLAFGVAITLVSGLMFLIIISVQFANVIRQVRLRRRIVRLLMTDIITGGNSWYAFEAKAIKVFENASNVGKPYAVVDLSVAKYQSYCSLHGSKAGEQLLVQVDQTFGSFLAKSEICAHVSGADFALFLMVDEGQDASERVQERVSQMIASFAQRASQAGNAPEGSFAALSKIMFRAGICFVEPSVTQGKSKKERRLIDLDDFYANACIAKDTLPEGENGVVCFTQEMWEEQLWQHKVEDSMQDALDNDEFQVYVQPKYGPTSGEIEGAEALVRWMSPTEGMVPPGRFIPIFEKTGFVTKLDDYMISHIAALQSEWLAQGKHIVPVSVNVSRAHFAQPDLAEHIRGLVDAYELPHEYIEIELTESAFFDDKKMLLETVRKLKDYGFKVSMDDFGSGYSSLNSLKDLPLDVLKLDAGFFRGDDFDTRGEIVVAEAIALAKRLNMKIVAEGIEKQEQVDFLAKQDCDMIQGYYYAKPMPAEEYAEGLSS